MALKRYITKLSLKEYAAGIQSEVQRIETAVASITGGRKNLESLVSVQGGSKTELASVAAANRDDASWQTLTAEMDGLTKECDAAKDWAILLEAALTGIDKP